MRAVRGGFEGAGAEARAHHPGFARGGVPILPTPVRLGAPEDRTGRGVTIAFLDSGFYAHPDLVKPRDRILRYVDVNDPRARRRDLERPDESSWHGMMTSVVACGNGWLSRGLYRGLASEASVVLVKVGTRAPDHARRHPPRARVGDPQPRALRDPHRQRQLRRRLRGELPRGRPLAGRRGGDAGRPPGGAPRPGTSATSRATRSCRPPRRRRSSPSAASTTRTGSRSRPTTCTTRATGRRSTGCRSRR